MYEEQLKELGLTDNEIKIYIVLLKQGAMNPYEIAEKTGLHRGYIYDALERMQEKEIVSSILKENKKHFQATNPENLVELLKLKLENLKKIIPNLKEMMQIPEGKTNVELHKGQRVYRTLIKDITNSIKPNSEILIIGIDEDILEREIELIYLKQYINALKSRKIKEKIIICKGKKRIKNPNIQYKEISEEFIGKTAQIIYGNKVAIFVLGSPYYLIVIDNKDVAETYKKQFNLLWKI